ncbi:MAG: metallophosphoesterase [Ignavibacteriaceae bacterium]
MNTILKLKRFFIPLLVFVSLQFLSSQTDSSSVQIVKRIILIGDAGEPTEDKKEPVLIALEKNASEIKDSTLIIFLGDNIYLSGLPDTEDSDRKEYERRINDQVNVVINSEAKEIFIPGNHDWDRGSDKGWEQIRREGKFLNDKGLEKVSFLPLNGCPGPVVSNFGENIKIIILDSQWWLQDEGTIPEKKDSLCNFCKEDEIAAALDSIIINSGNNFIVVAAHHPLSTNGPHGGYFTWLDHIFPLRNLNEYLWIPLPIIGSLYPLVRGSGISSQDLPSSEYQSMKNIIENVISKYTGLVYASGHEHALQVIDGTNENIYLVSGAGIWGHIEESLGEGDNTVFSGKYEGFMMIDFVSDGNKLLSVIKVINEQGESETVFSVFL